MSRKARVTEISGFGQQVRSWKREAGIYPDTSITDAETLWAADSVSENSRRQAGDCQRQSAGLESDEEYAALHSNRAAHYAELAAAKAAKEAL